MLVRGSLAAPGVGRSQGLPRRALVCAAPRAWLPLRAWLLPLGRELAFCFAVRCVYVAKSSRRAAAAPAAERIVSTGQPYAAAATKRTPRG